ncbi:hypothetical protein Trydic_g17472 [Trypoxylus dichotomus]
MTVESMRHIPQDDVLQIGLSLLKNMGERMHSSSQGLRLFRTFNLAMLMTNLFFILANLAHVEGPAYIKTTECALTICHAIFKYSLFIYYKNDIEKLLDDMKSFWNAEEFDAKFCFEVKVLYKNIKFAQVYYLATGLSCIAMYFLKPVINENNRFLFQCWTFTHSFELETLVLACQYYFWIVLFPVVFGYDSLYFSYCVHVIIQLRLLNRKFVVMTGNVTINEIGECIRHHQLILSIFARMKKVYFWMLLFHYFVTLITGCSQLYVILLGTTDRADLIATVIYTSGLLVQFAYYSFPVEEIVFELKNLSNSIYMSSWYEKELPIQRILLFVMTKAQRQKYLSAGGIIDINIDAFGSVRIHTNATKM